MKLIVFCHHIKYLSLTCSLSKTHFAYSLSQRFAWRTSEWKACQVSLLLDQQDPQQQKQAGLCGGGTQSRVVYCAQIIVEPGTQRPKEGACGGSLQTAGLTTSE